MTERDKARLATVHPDLSIAVGKLLLAMEVIGFPMMVTDGARTTAEQQALFAKGRTKPGPVVTKADGITNKSNHQTHEDGFGHAVDCCFVVAGKPSWDSRLPWKTYGAIAEALGLEWGGRWTFTDLPHVQLPATRAIDGGLKA